MHVVHLPRGAGRGKIVNLAKDKRTKKCIVEIRNNDNLCAPRAIVTGLTYHGNTIFGKEYNANGIKKIRTGLPLQRDVALELCERLGKSEEEFTLEDIKQCEELLDVQIKVVCAENFNSIIYKGCCGEKENKIYLYK